MNTTRVHIEIPEGYKLTTQVGYCIPDGFHSVQIVRVTGRKWWKFWLPKTVYVYVTVEKTTLI